MMASDREINAWFLVLHQKAQQIAGSDLPEAEREQVKVLCEVVLNILESVVLDLNRIADAAQFHANSFPYRH